ncbi:MULTISPECIES: stage V sporulation protein AA [Paenibacillus]|uniref:stage V sporulation protein AA n=1 Tax=Paenibacillus TaxID=44249 RepID=UPI0022B916A3|nr:stage V sporulation protein AA [Paenibacillus caseinilyticus]MCZ8520599.1 stage V sporulation protein AA [Paenibacillus caseinilyticus]
MHPASVPSLYIRLRKNRRIGRGEPVLLGQVAQLLLTGLDCEEELGSMVLYEPREADGSVVLIDMMLIVEKVKGRYPELAVEYFGEPHTLIEIGEKTRPPNMLLLAMVWLLLFVGSGLAIMNFHADVSMAQVHQHIYKLLTGRESAHPLLLQIPYSVGIGLGMIVFFNHLFKKKFNEEPSPLEVEMFMYQENVNHYVITDEYHRIYKEKEREEGGG